MLWSDCAYAQAISEAYDLLTETHSPENGNSGTEAKCYSFQLYDRLKAKELETKVKKVDEAHTEMAYSESWKLINDKMGR